MEVLLPIPSIVGEGLEERRASVEMWVQELRKMHFNGQLSGALQDGCLARQKQQVLIPPQCLNDCAVMKYNFLL